MIYLIVSGGLRWRCDHRLLSSTPSGWELFLQLFPVVCAGAATTGYCLAPLRGGNYSCNCFRWSTLALRPPATIWHPFGVRFLDGNLIRWSALALRPPATIWHPF